MNLQDVVTSWGTRTQSHDPLWTVLKSLGAYAMFERSDHLLILGSASPEGFMDQLIDAFVAAYPQFARGPLAEGFPRLLRYQQVDRVPLKPDDFFPYMCHQNDSLWKLGQKPHDLLWDAFDQHNVEDIAFVSGEIRARGTPGIEVVEQVIDTFLALLAAAPSTPPDLNATLKTQYSPEELRQNLRWLIDYTQVDHIEPMYLL